MTKNMIECMWSIKDGTNVSVIDTTTNQIIDTDGNQATE